LGASFSIIINIVKPKEKKMHSVSEKLGSVMKTARLEKHLTQKELAARLAISPYYLMSIENKKQIPSSDLLFQIIRELDISADTIFYPEHGNGCGLVNRLHFLLGKCEEHDIEVIIGIIQVLLQTKCSEGDESYCAIKCPFI